MTSGILHATGKRGRWALMMVVLNGLLFAWLLSPLLFGGRYVNHTDALLFDYPLLSLFGHRIGTLDVLWNDLSGAGFPSLLIHGFLFHPFLWLLLSIMNPVDALHATMFLYMWVGSALMALALLRMGYRPAAAWLGSAVFPFTIWNWLFEPTFSFFLPLFGGVCLAVSIMDTRPLMATWICGGLVALGFLSLQAHYAVLLFFLICLLWILRRVTLAEPRRLARHDVHAIAAIAVALCIGALRMLPLAAYGALSTRKGAFLDFYTGDLSIGTSYVFRYLFPTASLPFGEGNYFQIPFLGIGILLLAAIGILTHRRNLVMYAGLAIGVLFFSFAIPFSPTYYALQLIPFVKQLGDPTRYLLIPQLIVIALAVEGLHVLHTEDVQRVARRFSSWIIGTAILCILAGLAAAVAADDPLFFLSLRSTDMIFLSFGLLVIGILFAINRLHNGLHRYTGRLLAGIAVFLVLPGYWGTYTTSPLRDSVGMPPMVVPVGTDTTVFPFLAHHGFQDVAFYNDFPPEFKFRAGYVMYVPNMNLIDDVRNITMFDHLQSERLDKLLASIGSEASHVIRKEGDDGPSIESLQEQLLKRWHIVERLGISHVLTPYPLPGRTEKDKTLLLPQARVYERDGSFIGIQLSTWAYVYEVSGARHHVSVPSSVKVIPPDPDIALRMVLQSSEGDATIIECHTCPATEERSTGTSSLLAYTPLLTRSHVQLQKNHWVVIRRQLLPGWRATVDGRPVQASIADGIFMAIPVPAGDHDVVVRFSYIDMLKDAVMLLMSPARTPWFS